VRALVLLAYSPIGVLALGAYGSEGILRVYLFSLTWAAALCAMALAPSRTAVRTAQPSGRLRRAVRSAANALRVPAIRRKAAVLRVPLTFVLVLALFFPAFFGDDDFNAMTKSEVNFVTKYWLTALRGHVFLAIDDAPIADTWRYPKFTWSPIFGSNLRRSGPITYTIAHQLAQEGYDITGGKGATYVMVTNNMVAYNNAYGLTNPSAFTILLYSLRHDPHQWKRVRDKDGVIIYKNAQTVHTRKKNVP
jgi:hypothetical protein